MLCSKDIRQYKDDTPPPPKGFGGADLWSAFKLSKSGYERGSWVSSSFFFFNSTLDNFFKENTYVHVSCVKSMFCIWQQIHNILRCDVHYTFDFKFCDLTIFWDITNKLD